MPKLTPDRSIQPELNSNAASAGIVRFRPQARSPPSCSPTASPGASVIEALDWITSPPLSVIDVVRNTPGPSVTGPVSVNRIVPAENASVPCGTIAANCPAGTTSVPPGDATTPAAPAPVVPRLRQG